MWSAGYHRLYQKHKIILVSKNGKYGAITEKNEVVIPLIYSQLSYNGVQDNFISNDMLISSSGDTIIPPGYYFTHQDKFDSVTVPNYIVEDKATNKSGFIIKNRGLVIPCKYDNLAPDSNEDFIFFKSDTCGIVTRSGIEKQYFDCVEISPLINGRRICKFEIQGAGRSQFPSAQVTTSEKGSSVAQYRILDSLGTPISDLHFDWLYPFHGGYAGAIVNATFFMINEKGLPAQFENKYKLVSYFENGLGLVTSDFKSFGIMNENGKLLVSMEYEQIALKAIDNKPIQMVSASSHAGFLPSQLQVLDVIDGTIKVKKKDKEWVVISVAGK